LGLAYGELGQLYLAYDLVRPAESCLINAQALDGEDFHWPYLLGTLYQNERRLDRARESYLAALTLRPRDHPALVRLAKVYLARQEAAAAEPLFRRALAEQPGSPIALAGLGKVAAAEGRHEQAIAWLMQAQTAQPEANALNYPLALSLRELGRVDEARQRLAELGQVGVHFADPLAQELLRLATGAGVQLVLGNRALRQGSLEAARLRYQEALKIDPRNPVAHRALASLLARQKDYDAAVGHFSSALALEPRSSALHYNLGTVLVEQGEDEQALRHFEAAVRLDPHYANARFNLATVLVRMGRLAAAIEQYEALVEQEPEDFSSQFYLAQTLLQSRQFAVAVSRFEALVARDPNRFRVRLGLGRALAGAAQPQRAAVELQAAVELVAGEVATAGRIHLELAELMVQTRSLDAATRHYEAAVALLPKSSEMHRQLAAHLARQGQFDAAAESYGRVVSLAPGEADGRFGEAMALLLAGRDGEAAGRLVAGLAALPENPQLRHAFARLLATSRDSALRDGAKAMVMIETLLVESRRQEYAETLAMALAELGRFEEAIGWQQRVLVAGRQQGADESYLQLLRRRLDAYKRGEPCRAPWLAGASSD
jgi:tetratricopeptide (TPR) repeat protein